MISFFKLEFFGCKLKWYFGDASTPSWVNLDSGRGLAELVFVCKGRCLAFFVLDLSLDVVNGVRSFHVQSDGLPRRTSDVQKTCS